MELPYRSINEILSAKPAGVFSIAPDAPIFTALQLMAEKGVGFLVVLENDRLAGVFSERDYARKVVIQGRSSKDTAVSEAMTRAVYTVSPSRSVPDCMAVMTEKRIRHLPVMEGERVIGVLSIGDLVKEVISHHEHVIRDLEIERLMILTCDSGGY